ncbi:RCC1 domain-containing protein [Salinispora vitiensis]|uniref:RCC1 domain-containing protein n=1 Tax=Salinispora vitiensis TaxID=999544 RepID=UPI000363A558|nr:Ig-like domain repeat protein [Salinispora vitiensis]
MMPEIRRWVVRDTDARRAGRTVAGWLFLALAVTVTQVTGGWPALAQQQPAASSAMSETVLAWGGNGQGELGDGTTTDSSVPVEAELPANTTITAIAAGNGHSLALTSDGAVLAWGENLSGELGDGTNTNRNTPVEVNLPPNTTVTAIAAGHNHSLALTSTGTALAWGYNFFGQLGDGTTTNRNTPVEVDLPTGTTITAISAGAVHSLAITTAGTALAWGGNYSGQLGDGTTDDRNTPVEVDLPTGTSITSIAAGGVHSLAATSAGTAFAWGSNTYGELGDGTNTDRTVPVAVSLPANTTVTTITASAIHSLAMTSAGTALAWGYNYYGQLGDGTTDNSNTPVNVNLPTGTTLTTITAGGGHSLAMTSTGTALAWGGNYSGQLGDGTTNQSNTPVNVNLPTGTAIATITAGNDHGMALIEPPSSTTTLEVAPRNPEPDQDVTLTATVTCTTDVPTGTITFRNGSSDLHAVPLDGTNTAAHTTRLPAGTHTLTAHYTSTNTCPSGQSEATTITIDTPASPSPDTPDDPGLPITGPSLPTTVGAAALLLLIGTALIHLDRRRRPTHHPR